MKKVLVLGGGGFIGRKIVEHLLRREDTHVTAADIREDASWAKWQKCSQTSTRFKAVQSDFSELNSFEKFDNSFEEIYMLAAIVGVNHTLKNPSKVIEANTRLTLNTLSWLAKNPVRKVLFTSSSENYAATSDLFDVGLPASEDVPLCIGDITHPRWTYAITKIHGESAFFHSAKKLGHQCTIIRYQNIIGPNMGFGHAIPHIVERFVNKLQDPMKIYGHDQTRSFCFVDDAVEGTVAAMESDNSTNQIYHIGNPEEVTMDELTRFIGDLLQYSGEYSEAMTYPGSVSRRCPNIGKASRDFGYAPKYSWKDAVRLTVEWYDDFFSSGNKPSSGGFESPESIISKMSSSCKG
tara:strand:+ start:214 stop:1266 length:1053 start_codon:yes stop_codon:yes gene_type:complete